MGSQRITSIQFTNYKSFERFSISLERINILVGPNNAGKSTIVGSLKILAEGIRKAKSKNPRSIKDPSGISVQGYQIELEEVPVATENVFYNYNDAEAAVIRFKLSDASILQLFFPEQGVCFMNCEATSAVINSVRDFKDHFDLDIGYVPVLGPVEHREPLFQPEAARRALLTHRASRNFRNIWFHFPEGFPEFKALVKATWPGMEIAKPEIDNSGDKTVLNMFCPEDRIDREIYWSGFGFQVWCQMLTYILKSKGVSIFIVDEPDIYLHSDLQRQLLTMLKGLGPDILIATHSTEIISEAELNEILVVNKALKSAKRIKDPSELQGIFHTLGSNLNPTMTQIAKSRRVLFVEGKDYGILSKFAKKLGLEQTANRTDFAVVPVEGFNPVKLRAFKEGIEKTIGSKVISAVIFDRDYRSQAEVDTEVRDLERGNCFARIHSAKEIENFLLVPEALKSAINKKIDERNFRTGETKIFSEDIHTLLARLCEEFRTTVQAQLQSYRQKFEKSMNPRSDGSAVIESAIKEFESNWGDLSKRIWMVPGKDYLSRLNKYLQNNYAVGLSYSEIISNMRRKDVPAEVCSLIEQVDAFRKESVD